MNEEKCKSILQMARGAIEERVDYEMSRVIDNILDPNRQVISVITTAKSSLCPTNSVATSLFITGDEQGEVTAVEMVPNIPGQLDFTGGEQEPAPVLRIVKNA